MNRISKTLVTLFVEPQASLKPQHIRMPVNQNYNPEGWLNIEAAQKQYLELFADFKSDTKPQAGDDNPPGLCKLLTVAMNWLLTLLLICYIPVSNLGPETRHPKAFRGFTHSLHLLAGITPWVRPKSLTSASYSVYYSLIMLSFCPIFISSAVEKRGYIDNDWMKIKLPMFLQSYENRDYLFKRLNVLA
jgi:hypothetical protein